MVRRYLTPLFFLLIMTVGRGAQSNIPVTADSEAQILNLKGINTPYSEYTPFITADEQYLYFQSNRPSGVGEEGDFDLWFSENTVTDGTPAFKPPVNLGLPVNSQYFDGHPSLRKLPSGEYELYFASFAEDGREGPQLTNLYYSILKDGKWSPPLNLVEINTDFHDRMPSISQDGRYLFFSSDRPGGYGSDDIWYSEYDYAAKRWSAPQNAGRSINTPASEVTPALHTDNITLYFSSNRAGGLGSYDIHVTQMSPNYAASAMSNSSELIWKKPQNLGRPYNSEYDDEYPTVIRSGNFMYFASNRENGQGSFDIYRGKVPEFAKPEVVVTLKGRVKEKFSQKGIEANVRISDVDGERNFSTSQPAGHYSSDLVNKKQYKFTVTAPGYRAVEYIADLRDIHTPITIQKDFEMERELALPKDIKILVRFVDAKGNALRPNATYRLTPEMRDDSILRYRNSVGQIALPAMSRYKKPEDALAALDKMQLSLKATLKGFEDVQDERSIASLLRGANGELKDTLEIQIPMVAKEDAVEVVETKGPGGLEAIVYFSTNVSNRLNNEKAAGLKNVVALWNKQPHKYVYVYGHTDSRGTKDLNMKLSKARAEFVKKRLVQYGIPAEMIVTKGFGEKRLATKNERTDAGRRKNRRAEIYFDATKRAEHGLDDAATPDTTKPAKKKPAKKKTTKPLAPEVVEPSTAPKSEKVEPREETTPPPAEEKEERVGENSKEKATEATEGETPSEKPPKSELKIQ